MSFCNAMVLLSEAIRFEVSACFSSLKMFKHIFDKINVISVGKYAHSTNSISNLDKGSGKNTELNKTLKFEDIPGPRSYPVIGTLYKYLPIIGKRD